MKNETSIFNTFTILSEELNAFQTLLKCTNSGLVNCICVNKLPLEKVFAGISILLDLINEFKQVKSLTLLEQDYINFCLLLVYGSEMAETLPKLKNCPENSRKHAKAWKEVAIKFTPLLNNNLNN